MKFFFCDLETTGLYATHDLILEAAFIITDENLEELTAQQCVVSFEKGAVARAIRDPKVLEMHTKNGLIKDCEGPRSNGLYQIEECMVSAIASTCDSEEKPMLAGSSVHFDRDFIRFRMPRLNTMLHHRHFDVSVLQTGADLWAPEMVYIGGESRHRAMPDIRHSLDKARHYKRNLYVA